MSRYASRASTRIALLLFVATTSVASPIHASPPRSPVTLRVTPPPEIGAWLEGSLMIEVRNESPSPVLLLELEISSGAGRLVRYGYRGPSYRWVAPARGNRQGAGFLIYRPRRPPQQIVAPRRRTPTPTTRIALAAIEPLLPGKREQLSYRVLGEYRHKGTISVRLTYVLLDPKQHPICATPRGLMRTGFVLCEPVQVIKAGVGRLYTERDVLERGHRTLQRVVPLRVKRPNYHLDRARLRGGVATGPVAYDQVRKRWILFDAKRSRSVTVAPNFPTTDLPGNWLALFTNLNSQHEVFLRWTAHTPQRAAAILQALRKASIRAEYFQHKGHRSDRTLTVVVTRRTIDLLARVVREQRSALVGWSIAVVSMAKAPVGCLEPLGGAKRFCDGRVYPQGQLGHITWFAYHSPLTPAQLAARYLKACGRTNLEQQGTSYVWRFPVTRPTAVLSIGPTAERGPWYRCKLPASARSILSISHFPH